MARLAAIKDALEQITAEGQAIFEKFDSWYLAGPRKGSAPLLTANKVNEAELDNADKQEFATAVMSISQSGNEVKAIFQVGIAGAAKALLVRVDNLKSQLTKTRALALVDIRKSFSDEIEALRAETGNVLVALKLDHSIQQGKEFAARKGASFDRLKATPNLVVATVEANVTRLKTAESSIGRVEKTASRLIKGIPTAFQGDPEIIKLNSQLMKIVADHRKAIAEAKQALTLANTSLNAFLQNP